MKIPQFILVFLIFASLLLAGCTDRKPNSSNPSADLPKPTLSPGTPESSQPGTQENPVPETDSLTHDTSSADSSEPAAPSDSSAETETERIPAATSEPTALPDSSEEPGSQAATIENTSSADPVEAESTEDSGGIPVQENPTIYASGTVELIGGD